MPSYKEYQSKDFLSSEQTLEIISYWQEIGKTRFKNEFDCINFEKLSNLEKANFYYHCHQFENAIIFYGKWAHEHKQGHNEALGQYLERGKISGYKVCTDNKKKLAYFPIPKIACTSLKHLFYNILYDKFYDEVAEKRYIHQFFRSGTYEFSINHYSTYSKFTVIRDPIKRLISAYKNRVLFHDNLRDFLALDDIPTIPKPVFPQHDKAMLPPPSLNAFSLHLATMLQMQDSIRHHCNPIHSYLPEDLEQFEKIFRLEEINQLIPYLENFAKRKLELKHLQNTGPKIGLKDLSEEAFYALLDFYKKDYEIFHQFYSRDNIIQEYELAKQH